MLFNKYTSAPPWPAVAFQRRRPRLRLPVALSAIARRATAEALAKTGANLIIFFSLAPASAAKPPPTTNHQSPITAHQRPNVILIITDDQGYGDVSAHGSPPCTDS